MSGKRNGIDLLPFVALVLLFLILIWMIDPLSTLFVVASKDYNEGWNAFIAMRAWSDLPLYPQDQTLHTNNYPPLSFYIVGALGLQVGDNIFAGRIVSLVSTVAIAGEVAVVVRLLGGSWRVAGFAGLVFLGLLIVLDSSYIGMDDPQLLGHAVMLAGLIVLLRRRGAGSHLIVAAVVMVVAGLIKHNLMALPLAVTAWLFLTDGRSLWVWLGAAAAAVAGALLALWLLYGAPMLDNIASARSYSLARLILITKRALETLQIPLVGSSLLFVARPSDAASQLVALYGGCALLVGLVFAGGGGVGENAFFDLLIALSLGAGLLLQQVAEIAPSYPPEQVRAAVAAAYVLGIGLDLPGAPVRMLSGASPITRTEADTRADLTFLAGIEGRVMCETLALCYWAGKGFEVDTFNARQGFLARGHDERILLDLVRSGAFAAVQLTKAAPERDDERISPAFMDALLRHYRLARVSENGAFFVYAAG
jgi:4-amino-4-deoxy-L-arabinose transferase-like glycosyltransferase